MRAWQLTQTLWHSPGSYDPQLPTAAFDLDSTLIPCKSRGPSASVTIPFLSALAEGFNLVIFTNRGGGTPAHMAPVREFVAALDGALAGAGHGARASVYAATARDRWRKPHTGALEHFTAAVAKGRPPNYAFYCGDAAGRPGDHSAADLMFALNAGLEFVVPEALFGPEAGRAGAPPPPLWAPPESFGCRAPAPFGLHAFVVQKAPPIDLPGGACLVIMCGSPASGKSREARRLAAGGCLHLSNDLQGKAPAARLLAEALAQGRRVVVDNTHPLASTRAELARQALAAGQDYAVVVVHVTTPKELAFHLNAARCQLDATGETPELPAMAIHTFWKKLEPPSAEEVRGYGARVGRLVERPFMLEPDAPREVTHFRYPLK